MTRNTRALVPPTATAMAAQSFSWRTATRAALLAGCSGVAMTAWLLTGLGAGIASADTATGSTSAGESAAGPATTSAASAGPRRSGRTPAGAHSAPRSGAAKSGGAASQNGSTAVATVSEPKAAGAVPSRPVSRGAVAGRSSAAFSAAQPNGGADEAPAITTAAKVEANVAVLPAAQASLPSPFQILNNAIVTLLNPFLNPPPHTPGPIVPFLWGVMAWVRKDLFNQAPVINYNPQTTVQTGQTVIGNIGATDAEGDTLTYTVTQAPQYGTVTIDQTNGEFAYTPNDINYTAAQTDSFTVTVADGKRNILFLFTPHTATSTTPVTTLSPTFQRVNFMQAGAANPNPTETVISLPQGVTNPKDPRFAEDGQSLYFSAYPPGVTTGTGRLEIYQINIDGTNVVCVTCGVSNNITSNLSRVVPYQDGSGRLLIQTSPVAPSTVNGYVVYEISDAGRQLVPVIKPTPTAPGVTVSDPLREMRIAPDGVHVLFSQIQLTFPLAPASRTPFATAIPLVGSLVRTASGYQITDARVVYPVGEGKQFTKDGQSVIILGGQYDQGNVDDIQVNLATGDVSRVTANLDYDEDIDRSPNNGWIAVGSTRTFNALTPVSIFQRPGFLPADIQGGVYTAWAGANNSQNISNEEILIRVQDELNGVTGIPLYVQGDGYTARSMASWNPTGTAVAFWENSTSTLELSRLVIANVKYTTSVGTVQGSTATPNPTWAPSLSTYVPQPAPLPALGTYAGAGGGTAVVTEAPDPTPGRQSYTIRTVVYTNYVNAAGEIINGTEWTSANATRAAIRYVSNLTVTGTHTGTLTGDVTINKLTRTITPTTTGSQMTSVIDGQTLVLVDPAAIAQQRALA